VLRGEGEAAPQDIVAALQVTGHFLKERLLPEGRELPAARARLLEVLGREG
jgi:DNA repair protein RecO (recombination protein O)